MIIFYRKTSGSRPNSASGKKKNDNSKISDFKNTISISDKNNNENQAQAINKELPPRALVTTNVLVSNFDVLYILIFILRDHFVTFHNLRILFFHFSSLFMCSLSLLHLHVHLIFIPFIYIVILFIFCINDTIFLTFYGPHLLTTPFFHIFDTSYFITNFFSNYLHYKVCCIGLPCIVK